MIEVVLCTLQAGIVERIQYSRNQHIVHECVVCVYRNNCAACAPLRTVPAAWRLCAQHRAYGKACLFAVRIPFVHKACIARQNKPGKLLEELLSVRHSIRAVWGIA